ncbi:MULTISPECIES: hypothetical protein [unclassified Arcicella]|uniref:hypothetical protein n=1 Tax=unclassified Arcicella TaxID=2644986 RepID=UPI00285AF7F5|nr:MULTISPECIES: hypothetical protein [unclassified Arcicella]MDR6564965.1 hypothetical protein [Arcicella sp. BE51]MDR6814755.1 hypothetical protein [Arcicella sp. BE140]MDR6826201.1 hypothetical protein [Arcicella sp. BE139]
MKILKFIYFFVLVGGFLYLLDLLFEFNNDGENTTVNPSQTLSTSSVNLALATTIASQGDSYNTRLDNLIATIASDKLQISTHNLSAGQSITFVAGTVKRIGINPLAGTYTVKIGDSDTTTNLSDYFDTGVSSQYIDTVIVINCISGNILITKTY